MLYKPPFQGFGIEFLLPMPIHFLWMPYMESTIYQEPQNKLPPKDGSDTPVSERGGRALSLKGKGKVYSPERNAVEELVQERAEEG